MSGNIPIEALTQISLDGNGVFDSLMQAVTLHLEHEFNQGRIRGTEYATVYTASIAAVMQQSLAFLLEKEKAFYAAELEKQKVLTEQQQVKVLEQQHKNLQAEEDIAKATVTKISAETGLINAQRCKAVAEENLLAQKTASERAQVNASDVNPNSVIGKQMNLFQAQTDGFKRDAEQKAAKIFVDAVAVRDGIADESTWGAHALNNQNLTTAVNKLLAGI